MSSGTCSGAGAPRFVGRDGEAPVEECAGEEPDTSGRKLSGDWGALDSSAMDPGTLGCTWIAWLETEHRREFHSPENTPKQTAREGRERSARTALQAKAGCATSRKRWVAHTVSNTRLKWRQCASAHLRNKKLFERKFPASKWNQARSSAPFL